MSHAWMGRFTHGTWYPFLTRYQRERWKETTAAYHTTRAKKNNRINAFLRRGYTLPQPLYRGQPMAHHAWSVGVRIPEPVHVRNK